MSAFNEQQQESIRKDSEKRGPKRLLLEILRLEPTHPYRSLAESWLREQEEAADRLEEKRFRTTLRWTIFAAVAGVIAAIAAVVAAWFTVWPTH